VTGSCKHPLAGTADMKRVTSALREVNLPGSPPTIAPAYTKRLLTHFFSQTPSMLLNFPPALERSAHNTLPESVPKLGLQGLFNVGIGVLLGMRCFVYRRMRNASILT
jgi:hypothetical protein